MSLAVFGGLPATPILCGSISSGDAHAAATGDGVQNVSLKLNHAAVPGFKWRLVIAYDGTRYAGWQYQLSPPTVQCVLEKASTQITKLERDGLCLVGAGRTDAGVHAWGQMAHFITPFNYKSLESIHAALNGLLPSDIRIREVSPPVPEFHALFCVKSKIYRYKIYNGPVVDPFQRYYAYHSVYKLNPDMREGAKYFVGNHDFSAFANASRNDGMPCPVKEVLRCDLIEEIEVEGSGFLNRQVRNMVALLIKIGREAVPPASLNSIVQVDLVAGTLVGMTWDTPDRFMVPVIQLTRFSQNQPCVC